MKYFFFSTPPSRNFSIQNNGMKRLERNPPGEGEEDSVDILIEESGRNRVEGEIWLFDFRGYTDDRKSKTKTKRIGGGASDVESISRGGRNRIPSRNSSRFSLPLPRNKSPLLFFEREARKVEWRKLVGRDIEQSTQITKFPRQLDSRREQEEEEESRTRIKDNEASFPR